MKVFVYLSPFISTGRELKFQPHDFVMLFANINIKKKR